MEISKEELVACIEKARRKLEGSIEDGEEYCYVYEKSVISTKAVWMSFFF